LSRIVRVERGLRVCQFALCGEGRLREDVYVTSSNLTDVIGNQYTQFATIDGGTAFTPVFLARQNTFDARVEYEVAAPRVYVGVGYLHTPTLRLSAPRCGRIRCGETARSAPRPQPVRLGFLLPERERNYTVPFAASPELRYDVSTAVRDREIRYRPRAVFHHSPVYVAGGFSGDHYAAKQNAPIGQIHDGPYIGLGVKL